MATLVFTTLGTALGGPLGGALGALVGSQLDQAVIGSPKREGPRLKELAVTTSSYGTPIPRHFGRIRAPGTIVWATDLKETKEKSGGSKGQPSVTTYNYSASFAVALASRPIKRIGRIWADGNLLRGAEGDLKVGGELRVYSGRGNQAPDPLIASDRGPACPAFRNLAYCVFEDLHLADFGNRIPGLTFEILADEGGVTLAQMVGAIGRPVAVQSDISGVEGYSDEGGALSSTLSLLHQIYPLICDGSKSDLTLSYRGEGGAPVGDLPRPIVDGESEGLGALAGRSTKQRCDEANIPAGLRFYDVERDYQTGLQRADGRGLPGSTQIIEIPAALNSVTAKDLANSSRQRATAANHSLVWRMSQISPLHVPGAIVTAPGRTGAWRIEGWEWGSGGVELLLTKVPGGSVKSLRTDAGAILPPSDKKASPTLLAAFEVPWDGSGDADQPRMLAAPSSISDGWTGAALYLERSGELQYAGASPSRRSIVGHLLADLEASDAAILDRHASLMVELVAQDLALDNTTVTGLAQGHNRARIGNEIVQFLSATATGQGRWLVSGLLRGRGGTEPAARRRHPAGETFVLLDDRPVQIPSSGGRLAAIGLADEQPVFAEIENEGLGRQPPCPVHSRLVRRHDGSISLGWTRRARGSWSWKDTAEVGLVETSERYLIGVGDVNQPAMAWETAEPQLVLQAEQVSMIRDEFPGQPLWVKQVGTWGHSAALLFNQFI